jgi:hypothetical protein
MINSKAKATSGHLTNKKETDAYKNQTISDQKKVLSPE